MARAPAYPPETRELAKSLYLTGLHPKSIAQQLSLPAGAVRGWVRRLHWVKLRTNTLVAANSTPRSLAERSEAIRSTLANAFESHANQFVALKPQNGHAALKLHEKAEPMIRNFSKVLGWEPGVQVASIVSLSTIEPTLT